MMLSKKSLCPKGEGGPKRSISGNNENLCRAQPFTCTFYVFCEDVRFSSAVVHIFRHVPLPLCHLTKCGVFWTQTYLNEFSMNQYLLFLNCLEFSPLIFVHTHSKWAHWGATPVWEERINLKIGWLILFNSQENRLLNLFC